MRPVEADKKVFNVSEVNVDFSGEGMQIFNIKGHLPVLGQRPCIRTSSRLSPSNLPRIGAISRLLPSRRSTGSYAKSDDFEESGLPPPP